MALEIYELRVLIVSFSCGFKILLACGFKVVSCGFN